MERLIDKCAEIEKYHQVMEELEALEEIWKKYNEQHHLYREMFQLNTLSQEISVSNRITKEITEELDEIRDEVILKIAKDEIDTYRSIEILNTIKWLKRVVKHLNKFIFYYDKALEEQLA